MEPDPFEPPVGVTSWILKRAERASYAAVHDALRELGLTPSQYAALSALVRLGRASSADLARACFVTPQAMTGLVSKLEQEGYIRRRPIASSRVIEATATPRGKSVYEEGMKRVERFEEQLTTYLTEEENIQLRDMLARCIDALEGGRPRLTPDEPEDRDEPPDHGADV